MSFHGPRRQTLAIALLPLENAETDRMQWHADHAEQHTSHRKLREENQLLNTYMEEQWLLIHNERGS